jgi:hypothetical protein
MKNEWEVRDRCTLSQFNSKADAERSADMARERSMRLFGPAYVDVDLVDRDPEQDRGWKPCSCGSDVDSKPCKIRREDLIAPHVTRFRGWTCRRPSLLEMHAARGRRRRRWRRTWSIFPFFAFVLWCHLSYLLHPVVCFGLASHLDDGTSLVLGPDMAVPPRDPERSKFMK